MWGLYANEYMKDEKLVKALAMASALSCLGVLFGTTLNDEKISYKNSNIDFFNENTKSLLHLVFGF